MSDTRGVRGTVKDGRDGQKAKLYRWEDQCIAPFGGADISIAAAQGIINHIWTSMGLHHPPKVKKFAPNVSTKWATGSRLEIQMHSTLPTWVLLHELAHSMTMSFDHDENGPGAHNEIFVGVYMELCVKFLRMDALMLQHTATMCNVKFRAGAKPVMA